MKVDTDKIKWLLENETQYKISKDTGVAQVTLSGLISGKRKLENLTVTVADKLTEYSLMKQASQLIISTEMLAIAVKYFTNNKLDWEKLIYDYIKSIGSSNPQDLEFRQIIKQFLGQNDLEKNINNSFELSDIAEITDKLERYLRMTRDKQITQYQKDNDIRFHYSDEDIIRYSKAEYPFGADKYIWIAGDGELLATIENIRPKSKDSDTVIKVGKVIGNTLDRTQ
ncbi:hypothetical protein [Streptococcus parauberis]|uniref:hypothetical protein n=1 Tax=Streptococcus parauberis TaxID=1348 RepID=UPI0037A9873D